MRNVKEVGEKVLGAPGEYTEIHPEGASDKVFQAVGVAIPPIHPGTAMTSGKEHPGSATSDIYVRNIPFSLNNLSSTVKNQSRFISSHNCNRSTGFRASEFPPSSQPPGFRQRRIRQDVRADPLPERAPLTVQYE